VDESALEDWALGVAQESDSDFLLTGRIDVTASGTNLMPLLYVNPSRLPDPPEIGGWYSATSGSFIPANIPENPQALGDAYSSLGASMVTLITLGSVLQDMELHRQAEAAVQLRAATMRKSCK
jgi:hypothetical protein